MILSFTLHNAGHKFFESKVVTKAITKDCKREGQREICSYIFVCQEGKARVRTLHA